MRHQIANRVAILAVSLFLFISGGCSSSSFPDFKFIDGYLDMGPIYQGGVPNMKPFSGLNLFRLKRPSLAFLVPVSM